MPSHTCSPWPQVDVWALGISSIEMAEVTPPRWAVHPMRVIFMVSRDPPPRLADKDRWSLTFQDFVAQSLQKVGPCCHEAVCVLILHQRCHPVDI